MQDILENGNNRNDNIEDTELDEEDDFKYNFINIPWDDRTEKSKIAIIVLLLGVFSATMALVFNNYALHYRNYTPLGSRYSEPQCHYVKVDNFGYVVRITSITSENICVGALVGSNRVLTNDICVKGEGLRLRLGNVNDPRCRKGFAIKSMEPIVHNGVIGKKLVLITTSENISVCGKVIKITSNLESNASAYIIGKPMQGDKYLTHQPAKIARGMNLSLKLGDDPKKVICAHILGKCTVQVGDLLVQHDRLLGLAATTVPHGKQGTVACFADFYVVETPLKMFGISIAPFRE